MNGRDNTNRINNNVIRYRQPGVNAGPNTACTETPVNGRQRFATALPVSLFFVFVLTSCLGCGDNPYAKKPSETAKAAAKSDESDGLHWPKVVVSKETTYFTEPLRPDGGVDYVATFNKRLSEGVTPENNALIPILRATGPKDIDKKIRKGYFQALGIPELPEEGDYLIGFWDLPEYKEAEKKSGDECFSQTIWLQHQEITKAPWSKQDYPFWATVFERNEKLLDMVVEGLRRPRFHSPLVIEQNDKRLIAVCDYLSGISGPRWVIRLLGPRAMLRLHDGDVSGTWGDILAMYRLARLESHLSYIVNWMVGATFVNMACNAADELSRYEGLSAAQARECQRQLSGLPGMHPFGEICNEAERCRSLELLTMISTPKLLEEYYGMDETYDQKKKRIIDKIHNEEPEWKRRRDACRKLIVDNDVDWSEVFRQYNLIYDRLANACRRPKCTEAAAMLKALEAEVILQSKQIADAVLDNSIPAKKIDSKTRAQNIATLAILQTQLDLWRSMVHIEQTRQAREHMTMLAFALAGYRAEHDGEYPKTLAELVPNYIDAISKDSFTDGDFRYRAENGGYLLYSVGRNGKDDEGRGRDDYPESVPFDQRNEWDDISIRTPRKSN